MREDLDMLHGTFVRPDLTTFTGLGELGLEVVAQRVEPGQASLVCRVADTGRLVLSVWLSGGCPYVRCQAARGVGEGSGLGAGVL